MTSERTRLAILFAHFTFKLTLVCPLLFSLVCSINVQLRQTQQESQERHWDRSYTALAKIRIALLAENAALLLYISRWLTCGS